MRYFITFILLLFAPAVMAAEEVKRPNVLIIFTDDQRWDAMHCAGNDRIRTPNLDSLARRGTRFSNAFVTLSICSPSRAALLTGRYNSANGVTTIGKGKLNDDEVTFGHLMRDAGYKTAVTGKWHLGNTPAECGFDFSTVCISNGRWYGRSFQRHDGSEVIASEFIDDFIAEESIRFMRDATESDKPFVLWMCTQVPHMDHRHTWPASESFLSHHDAAAMPVPPTWQDGLAGKPPYLTTSRSRIQALHYGYGKEEAIRKHQRDYYASVEQMDNSLGKVLAELDRLGQRGNTWIFFMGDNGWLLGEHGLTSKVLAYEESIRVPMIVAGPDTQPQVCDEMVLGIDLTATLLQTAGIELPNHIHGRSLSNLVSGKTVPDWREDFLYEAPDPQLGASPFWALRSKRWKYIETPQNGNTVFRELYDLETDPIEAKNLAELPAQAGRVADLSIRLEQLKQSIAEH